MKNYRLFIDGQWLESKEVKPIANPYNGEKVGQVHQATAEQFEKAIEASRSGFDQIKKLSRFTRSRLLLIMAREIERRRSEFVERIVNESGKPKILAEGEVSRALITFTVAAEEAKRFAGEVIPIDIDAGGRAFSPATALFFPRGPVLAITPFNFPLNLVAHKVAPALAVGTSVLLKPPPQAPGAATLLAEVFEGAAKEASDKMESVPLSAFQVVSGSNEVVGQGVRDPRLSILSFTGSDKVGWHLQTQAPRKKALLELGGNAAVIVHSDADLKRAATRCAYGANAYAGQTCISVQRIYVHDSIYSKFFELLKEETLKVKCGDPRKEDTLVGPVIDKNAADRIESWIGEAVKDGAQLFGGKREGLMIAPALLTGVKMNHKISCEEVFGPVAIVEKYKEIEQAFELVNDSRFGLQAGVFTDSSQIVDRAFEELDVGGVIVNEIPTYRADHMPYGGVKDSGLGREGLRYAMEDYCERKILVKWTGQ